MTQSAAQASRFYAEVAQVKKLWTIKDSNGFPAPLNGEGRRVQPFWSSLSRVESIIQNVPAYADFKAHELDWSVFADRWVSGLSRDGILIGVNWSGESATGYDLTPEEVKRNIEQFISA